MAAKKKKTVSIYKGRGRPKVYSEDSRRLALRLEAKEFNALHKYAEDHCWTVTTAVRLILQEKLLKKKIPK